MLLFSFRLQVLFLSAVIKEQIFSMKGRLSIWLLLAAIMVQVTKITLFFLARTFLKRLLSASKLLSSSSKLFFSQPSDSRLEFLKKGKKYWDNKVRGYKVNLLLTTRFFSWCSFMSARTPCYWNNKCLLRSTQQMGDKRQDRNCEG